MVKHKIFHLGYNSKDRHSKKLATLHRYDRPTSITKLKNDVPPLEIKIQTAGTKNDKGYRVSIPRGQGRRWQQLKGAHRSPTIKWQNSHRSIGDLSRILLSDEIRCRVQPLHPHGIAGVREGEGEGEKGKKGNGKGREEEGKVEGGMGREVERGAYTTHPSHSPQPPQMSKTFDSSLMSCMTPIPELEIPHLQFILKWQVLKEQ